MSYFRVRLSSWVCAGVIFALGIIMFHYPASFGRPAVNTLAENTTFWTYSFLLIGFMRLTFLFINGHWKRTPILRFIGSCLGVGLFSALLTNYLQGSNEHSVSFGVASMGGLIFMDLCNAFFTLGDIAHRHKQTD